MLGGSFSHPSDGFGYSELIDQKGDPLNGLPASLQKRMSEFLSRFPLEKAVWTDWCRVFSRMQMLLSSSFILLTIVFVILSILLEAQRVVFLIIAGLFILCFFVSLYFRYRVFLRGYALTQGRAIIFEAFGAPVQISHVVASIRGGIASTKSTRVLWENNNKGDIVFAADGVPIFKRICDVVAVEKIYDGLISTVVLERNARIGPPGRFRYTDHESSRSSSRGDSSILTVRFAEHGEKPESKSRHSSSKSKQEEFEMEHVTGVYQPPELVGDVMAAKQTDVARKSQQKTTIVGDGSVNAVGNVNIGMSMREKASSPPTNTSHEHRPVTAEYVGKFSKWLVLSVVFGYVLGFALSFR